MKKVISALLIVSMLGTCLFTGCSTSGAGNEGTDNSGNDDATKITFYVRELEDWEDRYFEDMAALYNSEHSDVQINLKFFASDVYSDALTVARENGNSPDIYLLEYASVVTHAKNGYITSLDELLQQEALDDLFDNVKDMVTYEDQVYAYPWNLEPGSLFFYRKDILENNGIKEAPDTWEELYDVCETIKSKLNLGQYCMGLPSGASELTWTTYGMQYNTMGQLVVDDSWMVSNIEDKGYEELCELFYNIYRNGYAPATSLTSRGYTDIISALCEDKVAMCIGGAWSISIIYEDYPEMAEKIGVAQIPTIDGDQSKTTSANGGWTFCISEDSRKKEEAAEFIEWLMVESPERAGDYFVRGYNSKAPTSNAVSEWLEANPSGVDLEWKAVVDEVAAKGIPEAQFPWDISYAVGQMLEAMQVNAKSSSFDELYGSASKTAKSTIESVMSRSSYEGNPRYKED